MANRRIELEAALQRDPYDDAMHAVYADYLIEQGDPRGELAALTTASEWNRDALPGLVAFLEAHPELVPPGRARLTWRGGFIQRAEVGIDDATELLRHPSTGFLAELVIENRVYHAPTDDPRAHDGIAPVLGSLALQRRRALRSFAVTVETPRMYQGWLGDITALSDGAPELERLALVGGMRLDRIHLPRLQELSISEFRMQPGVADALRRGSWPVLSTLALQAGHCTYETLDRIAAWLTSVPSLTTLALTGTPHIHRVLVPMMASGALRDIRTLDLRYDQLTDDHLTIFEGRRAAWSHLEHLDLSYNRLSKRGADRARALARRVTVEPQLPIAG